MAGKGRAYWLSVWEGCHVPEYADDYLVVASERMLKRYGYLCSLTTYGEHVHGVFFKQNGSYPKCATMGEVIYRLQQAIANKGIKQDGDLHQILQIMGEKEYGDSDYYFRNKYFTLEPRVSYLSMFNAYLGINEEYIARSFDDTNFAEMRCF